MQSKIGCLLKGKSGEIYAELLGGVSDYPEPHQFISDAYSAYESSFLSKPSINGRIFEFLICECLAREGVMPFYHQANFERVPNANFDIVLYHRTKPVALSCKTSLRERYKQADLEGAALKQVYRSAKCYLLTLDHNESRSVQRKIQEGAVAGLDGCIDADTQNFTKLLGELGKNVFTEGKKILPVTGTFVNSGSDGC
ncbi:MAG: hypothetical protein GDA52_01435 [Rhodobacteraceae bacterium]|nr:hypothetical protein [Paracoccaceae bacterium]